MSIEKLEEFAKDGDKNLDNLDVSQGFLQSEKPERQWFNDLFNKITKKTNEVIDGVDAASIDTNIVVTAKNGGIERGLAEKNNDVKSINDIPSADTNEASKDLEIDLLGKAIDMPNEQNKYINGYVEKSDHLVWRGNHQTPFGKANIKPIISDFDGHFGFNSGIVDVSTDASSKWVCVYRRAPDHALINGSQIWACDSFDFGQTWTKHRVIYSITTYDTRNFVFSALGNGRIGLVASRRNEDADYGDVVFIYSDDRGLTWRSVNIATGGVKINFHGALLNRPETVGGDDVNSWIAYSYNVNANITAIHTNDNGETWTVTHDTAKADGVVTTALSECAITRLGSEDKWLMVCRNALGSEGKTNAVALTSTDMINWTKAVDTGLFLSNNPPQLIYDWGRFWLISFSRTGRQIIKGQTSHIVIASADANEVYNNGGSFGDAKWQVVAEVPDWATGYMHTYKIKSRWFASFVCGEQKGGGVAGSKRNILCLLGDFTSMSLSHIDVLKLSPRESLNANGQMQLWSVIDQSRYSISPVPKYASRLRGTAGISNAHHIRTRVHDIRRLTDKRCTLSFWLRSGAPAGGGSISSIRAVVRYGVDGSTPDVTTIAEDLHYGRTWFKYEFQVDLSVISGKTITSDDHIDINYYMAAGEYDIELTNVKFEDSGSVTAIIPQPDYIERSRIMSKVEMSATLSSEAITVNRQPSTMICNVSTSGASASMTTINGGMLGQQIVLAPASGKTITVSDGVNIKTNGNCVLASVNDQIVLINRGTFWAELSRSVNG